MIDWMMPVQVEGDDPALPRAVRVICVDGICDPVRPVVFETERGVYRCAIDGTDVTFIATSESSRMPTVIEEIAAERRRQVEAECARRALADNL